MIERILQDRFALTAVVLFGIGVMNMILQPNLLRKVVGFNIMDSAIFLLLDSLGYIEGHAAPVVEEGVAVGEYISPIPSGLVLTGIVVSVSITAFALALIQQIYQRYGTIELPELARKIEEAS